MSQTNEELVADTDEIAKPARTGVAGRVVFVGVLPAVAEGLTIAGQRAIQRADAVIGPSQLLDALSSIHVRPSPQADCLVDRDDPFELTLGKITRGDMVVRLIAGDPLLEGGIADEAARYSQAGYPVEILPAVPLITARASFAGVHFAEQPVQLICTRIDQQQIVIPASGSVAVSCFLGQVEAIAQSALEAGRSESDPVLLTDGAGTFSQQTRQIQLSQLAAQQPDEDTSRNPALVVIGPAAQRRTGLDWFETSPLFGWKVLVPRTRTDTTELTARLARYGAHSTEVPTISVEPPRNPQHLDKAIRGLVDGRYEWIIFTSGHAVHAVFDKLSEYGLDSRAFSGLRIASVGEDTTATLKEWGIVPDLHPADVQTVAGLAAEFPAYDDVLDPINKVFIPRADIATEPLSAGLSELGWDVDDVIAYRTVRAAPPEASVREAIKTGLFDAVVFTSSTTVRNLVGIAGKPHQLTQVAAIGQATAQECESHGLRVDVVAEYPGQLQLADALAGFARHRRDELLAAGKPVTRPTARRRRRSK